MHDSRVNTHPDQRTALDQEPLQSFEIRKFENSVDWELAHELLDEEHFLGAGREAGDRIGQFVLENGEIVAILIWCASATGKKKDSEVSEAKKLLADSHVNLVNKTVTFDPLHNKKETMDIVVKKGGEYIVGTKENTSKRLETAKQALKGSPLLASKRKKDTDA